MAAAFAAVTAGFLMGPAQPLVNSNPRVFISMKTMQAQQIEVGQPFPAIDGYLEVVTDGCAREDDCPLYSAEELLGSPSTPSMSVLVGMPGAFTPTCTDIHLPGYIRNVKLFNKLGVKTVAVVTTNDRFIMTSWKTAMKECMDQERLGSLDDRVTMIADKDAELTKALGLAYNSKAAKGGLGSVWQMFNAGLRSKRFVLLIKDGVVEHVAVDEDEDGEFISATSAEAMLDVVREKTGRGTKAGSIQAAGDDDAPAIAVLIAVAAAAAYFFSVGGLSATP